MSFKSSLLLTMTWYEEHANVDRGYDMFVRLSRIVVESLCIINDISDLYQ